MNKNYFDVIVVGGGHSGVEASSASARMGCKTLLITNNIDSIGQMSCNPSIGGIGKSHLVKEIDSLGGIMGIAIDRSGIQFRKLNISKGAAVQSTRAQADRYLYQKEIKKLLFNNKNLNVIQQEVIKLIIKNFKIKGVTTNLNINIFSKSVVLSLGTFLDANIYIGKNYFTKGGRIGDISAKYLSYQLKEIFPIYISKLKTGTPPRIDKRTINFNNLEKQNSDYPLPMFSFIKQKNNNSQISCYITKTNKFTHEIIKENIHKSPIYSNIVNSKGPRYCPSIEDKIIKFSKRESHQIFLEPEGINNNEIYPNGISTSLPINIQTKIINSIKGLEKSKITRPGYTVEYNFLDPRNLKYTLESKIISGLFFSGQLNGTTGYEEAAAQGIISGINAARFSKNKKFLYIDKKISYIGVMINDLCKCGVIEPYRIFTSRSENRLSLREDNADIRLTSIGKYLKLISNHRWKMFKEKLKIIKKEKERFKNIFLNSNSLEIINLNKKIKNKISCNINIYNLLRHSEINYKKIFNIKILKPFFKKKYIYKIIENDIKYENYIIKQDKEINILNKNININIPKNINFSNIPGLSNEVVNIFEKYKPNNLNDILNIPGITPASLIRIIIFIKKNNNNKNE